MNAPLRFLAVLCIYTSPSLAGPLQQAAINQIVKDVKVVDPAKGARPATLQETIKDDLAVKTGVESRAELLFQDNTLTRLSSSAIAGITLNGGNAVVNLTQQGGSGGKLVAGASTKIIAGKTVTIDDSKTVTIGGEKAAQVFTDTANYTGSGGNGSKTGKFAGAGATTSGFANRPAF